MVNSPFVPPTLVGRADELQQISQILAQDGDLLLTGIPGSGRRTLLRAAAREVGARAIEIDCLRATNRQRFMELLAEGLVDAFAQADELSVIQRWSMDQPLALEHRPTRRPRLTWPAATATEWPLFQALLALPQVMAEVLDCRVVLVFQNFPHLRSWDRSGQWEEYLRQEIQRQSRVSYALIATIAEPWTQNSDLQVINLPPLTHAELQPWILQLMTREGLDFEPSGQALNLFLNFVQGHMGDAIALARRVWLECRAFAETNVIQAHHVHRSALALVQDLSLTFEALILLLPPSQVRVLESLALDPTDSPHARDYIRKHQLSRGGSLQGALASLEQKGLVYGPRFGYRIAMPLLAFWLKHRIV